MAEIIMKFILDENNISTFMEPCSGKLKVDTSLNL